MERELTAAEQVELAGLAELLRGMVANQEKLEVTLKLHCENIAAYSAARDKQESGSKQWQEFDKSVDFARQQLAATCANYARHFTSAVP